MVNEDNIIQQALGLKDKGDYEESLDLLRDLTAKTQKKKKITNILIKVLFEYGHHLTDEWILKYDKGKEIFEEIINLSPNNYRAHYNLGISLFYLRQYEKALLSFNKALKIKPDYKYCHYNIGLVYEEMNLFKKALKAYNRALKIDPNFSYAKQGKQKIERAIETNSLPLPPNGNKKTIQQLKSLFRVSKKININDIKDILDSERKKLLSHLVDWAEDYGFELDGDYLILNKESLPEFLNDLNILIENINK
jgi:tetratricopeptide (TPR) repeat protein